MNPNEIQYNPAYERGGLASRIKDLSILAVFTLILALVSTIAMDIIIYPIAAFALSHTRVFSLIIKYGFILFIAAFFLSIIIKRVRSHLKNGLTLKETLIDLVKAPASILAIALFVIFLSAIIIGAVYMLLNTNNRIITLFMNN
ncbi:MAG: hypothetical protein FWG13_06400 [Leptospirales bacterium]|nr:hypothetical protein [Leptospirales bacterium]